MLAALTTALDLLGLALLVLAAAVLAAQWSLPAALAVAGVGLLATSWLVDRRAAPPTPGKGKR